MLELLGLVRSARPLSAVTEHMGGLFAVSVRRVLCMCAVSVCAVSVSAVTEHMAGLSVHLSIRARPLAALHSSSRALALSLSRSLAPPRALHLFLCFSFPRLVYTPLPLTPLSHRRVFPFFSLFSAYRVPSIPPFGDISPVAFFSFFSGGDLRNFLTRPDAATMDASTKLQLISEVAAGAAYLAAKSIVHRYIAAENVLLDALVGLKKKI